jgi:hypothetical protein
MPSAVTLRAIKRVNDLHGHALGDRCDVWSTRGRKWQLPLAAKRSKPRPRASRARLPSRLPGFFLLPGRVSFVLRALAALARNQGLRVAFAHLSGRKTAYVPRCLPQPAAEAPVLLLGRGFLCDKVVLGGSNKSEPSAFCGEGLYGQNTVKESTHEKSRFDHSTGSCSCIRGTRVRWPGGSHDQGRLREVWHEVECYRQQMRAREDVAVL